MQALKQRPRECSLCSVCTLNSLSQADYHAVSDLAREAGARYNRTNDGLTEAISIGLQVAKALGLYSPPEYRSGVSSCDTAPPVHDFSGKGIARIIYKRKRCRNFTAHVVAFENGIFHDSDGKAGTWEEMLADYKLAGSRDVKLTKIFR